VVLNLANNDLDGVNTVDVIKDYLRQGRNLLELNLSQNRVCDAGIIKLSGIFEENSCVLTRLIVHQAKITILGAA
jgi:hypothetical protein